MITSKLERFRRALWTWRQPLTRRPADTATQISDLFVWRNSREWQTSFELIDLPALFADIGDAVARYATMVVFDQNGHRFLEIRLDLLPNRRQTIDLSAFIGDSHGEVGTFAVFHSSYPPALKNMGSFLAERGYVSYRYRDAPLRTYVHGNFDAIALGPKGELEFLGASGLLPREYRLQHEMRGSVLYELGMVNTTAVIKHCTCQLISINTGMIISCQRVKLTPGGVQVISFQINKSDTARMVIKSRLVMARPLVFRIQNYKLDVFHG